MTVVNLTRAVELAPRVRVADGHLARLVGLLATSEARFRECGLWIVPCKGVHMLGMRYPIDALYLDRDLRIIDIVADLRPWRLGPVRREAYGVLEVAQGTARATATAVGDQLALRARPAAARAEAGWSARSSLAK